MKPMELNEGKRIEEDAVLRTWRELCAVRDMIAVVKELAEDAPELGPTEDALAAWEGQAVVRWMTALRELTEA